MSGEPRPGSAYLIIICGAIALHGSHPRLLPSRRIGEYAAVAFTWIIVSRFSTAWDSVTLLSS